MESDRILQKDIFASISLMDKMQKTQTYEEEGKSRSTRGANHGKVY